MLTHMWVLHTLDPVSATYQSDAQPCLSTLVLESSRLMLLAGATLNGESATSQPVGCWTVLHGRSDTLQKLLTKHAHWF